MGRSFAKAGRSAVGVLLLLGLQACGPILKAQKGSFGFTIIDGSTGDSASPPTMAELAWVVGLWKRTDVPGDAWIVPSPTELQNFRQVLLRNVPVAGGGGQGQAQMQVPCHYMYLTAKMPVFARAPSDATHYVIQYQASDVQLVPSPLNGPACAAWVSQQSALAKSGGLNVRFEFYKGPDGRLVIPGAGTVGGAEAAGTFERRKTVDELLR